MELVKAEPSSDNQVYVRMLDMDNTFISFKLKRNIPLVRLMNIYCNKKGLVISQVRFLNEGKPVKVDDTPESLKLKNGCVFDIYPMQTGGGFMK